VSGQPAGASGTAARVHAGGTGRWVRAGRHDHAAAPHRRELSSAGGDAVADNAAGVAGRRRGTGRRSGARLARGGPPRPERRHRLSRSGGGSGVCGVRFSGGDIPASAAAIRDLPRGHARGAAACAPGAGGCDRPGHRSGPPRVAPRSGSCRPGRGGGRGAGTQRRTSAGRRPPHSSSGHPSSRRTGNGAGSERWPRRRPCTRPA
jgi:hypothetical protein